MTPWRLLAVAVLLVGLALCSTLVGAQTVIVYSHHDAAAAQRARRLAMVYDQVVIDLDLQPGQPWRPALAGVILRAQVVLVLWSARAAASTEVAVEWRLALQGRGRLVPVLLDDTPLPSPLAELHGVDWRQQP